MENRSQITTGQGNVGVKHRLHAAMGAALSAFLAAAEVRVGGSCSPITMCKYLVRPLTEISEPKERLERYYHRNPPVSLMSEPSRPCGAARESFGNRCRCEASGCAVPRSRLVFPSRARGSRYVGQAERRFLAIGRARFRPDLQFHQLIGGKADHLPQQIRIRALLNKRAQVHISSVIVIFPSG